MSKGFALFVAEDLPKELRTLPCADISRNPRASEIVEQVTFIVIGETASTSIGEKVPATLQSIQALLIGQPVLLDAVLQERIIASLEPPKPFPFFDDEPAG